MWRFCCFGLGLWIGVVYGKPEPMPVDLTNAVKVRCEALQVVDKNRVNWWHVHVSVEYSDKPKWIWLYAIYEGDQRSKALKSCNKWMSVVHKKLN